MFYTIAVTAGSPTCSHSAMALRTIPRPIDTAQVRERFCSCGRTVREMEYASAADKRCRAFGIKRAY